LGVTNGSLISTVTAAQDQPPSSVALTSPANGMSYLTPTSVTLTATASDPDDGVARVDFMDGSSVIVSSYAAPYAFTLANPGAGTHSLAAVAYDSKPEFDLKNAHYTASYGLDFT
jgi:chitinase